MLRQSRIHSKKEDSLAKYRQWEFFIKNTGSLLTALAKLGLFLGILNVFFYIWKIGFMPSGLSLSDGITFVFSVLAVSLLLSFATLCGTICTYWVHFLIDGFLNKRWWRKKPENFHPTSQLPNFAQLGWALYSFFLLLFILALLYPKEFNINTQLFLFSSAALGFLLPSVVMINNNSEKNRLTRRVKFFIVVLTLISNTVLSNGEIFSIAMKVIGIRYENVSIETNTENIQRVRSLTKIFKIYTETCPLAESNHQLILNANILWTGIGNRTLIELVNPRTFVELNDAPKKLLYVQFDSSIIWPVFAHSLSGLSNRTKINLSPCQDKNKG